LCNACGLYVKLHGHNRPVHLRTDVIRQRSRENARVRVKRGNSSVASMPQSRASSRTRSIPQVRRHSAIETDDEDDEDSDESWDEPEYRSIGTQWHSDSEDSESVGTPDEGPSDHHHIKYGVKRQRIAVGGYDSDSIGPSLSSLAAVAAAVASGAYPDSLSRSWYQRLDL
jgi:hypothetical protein